VHELTQREVQVLALLDRGGTNSSVARELGLTTNTVKWYCTQIFAKLDAPNRTAALARARDLGLLA
jgi:DNA-binding NarL/FixJ family response regulator